MKVRVPFQGLKGEQWSNLAPAALIFFYAMYLILEVALRTMCGQLGVDYCDYVSAGRVASSRGYPRIYDLQLLNQTEKGLLPPAADPSSIPVDIFPYLPVFVLPFQALGLLSPETGFWLWTGLKIAVLVLYLRFFARSLHLNSGYAHFMLMMFASLPVFQDIFSGQVDVWLMICVGEFMRALMGGRSVRAGLWLGGLLLKPQTLLLLGPFLLLRRSGRVIAGLIISGLLLLLASTALIGPVGIRELAGLWLLYLGGHPSNLVVGMINWRMLGLEIANATNPWLGYGIAGAATMATLVIGIFAWRRPLPPSSPGFVKPLLGILAATTLVAWHSHIFMAMIVIPPLMYLYSTRDLSDKMLSFWVLPPAILYCVSVFVPEALVKLNLHVDHVGTAIYVILGLAQFVVDSCLFWWSVRPAFGEAHG